VLGSHVNQYEPAARQMFENLHGAMMARGADSATAAKQATATMFGMVQRQSAMLSFNETFHALAVLFFLVVPLLLIMKRPTRRGGGPPAH
jgi:DHA2 family multidrug resistance protein